jgi:excisionase family DNA binding protein
MASIVLNGIGQATGVILNEPKYRVPEAAGLLAQHPKTIWNKIANGDIAVYRIGRSVRIGESEIRRILEEGFQPARRRVA